MGNSAGKGGKGGADIDVKDPISGLSPRQARAVQSTWALVYSDPLPNGVELLKRLFRSDPETKQFFNNFRTMSEQELVNSPRFRAHAMVFMNAVNLAVANLQRPDMVGSMMDLLGETHNRRRVNKKHFNSVKNCLVDMLQNDLQLNEDQMKAWGIFVEFLYKHIFSKLNTDQM